MEYTKYSIRNFISFRCFAYDCFVRSFDYIVNFYFFKNYIFFYIIVM